MKKLVWIMGVMFLLVALLWGFLKSDYFTSIQWYNMAQEYLSAGEYADFNQAIEKLKLLSPAKADRLWEALNIQMLDQVQIALEKDSYAEALREMEYASKEIPQLHEQISKEMDMLKQKSESKAYFIEGEKLLEEEFYIEAITAFSKVHANDSQRFQSAQDSIAKSRDLAYASLVAQAQQEAANGAYVEAIYLLDDAPELKDKPEVVDLKAQYLNLIPGHYHFRYINMATDKQDLLKAEQQLAHLIGEDEPENNRLIFHYDALWDMPTDVTLYYYDTEQKIRAVSTLFVSERQDVKGNVNLFETLTQTLSAIYGSPYTDGRFVHSGYTYEISDWKFALANHDLQAYIKVWADDRVVQNLMLLVEGNGYEIVYIVLDKSRAEDTALNSDCLVDFPD